MRPRILSIVLVVVGLFLAGFVGAYPIVGELWHAQWRLPGHNEITAMFGSLYLVLGIFLLLAARRPAAHRMLISFAAWSSLAHAAVMSVQAAQAAVGARGDFVGAAVLFYVIGAALLALTPAPAAVAVGV
ncbi:MAG: DUF6632 domain-containing protein [Terriglobales bacterium]